MINIKILNNTYLYKLKITKNKKTKNKKQKTKNQSDPFKKKNKQKI